MPLNIAIGKNVSLTLHLVNLKMACRCTQLRSFADDLGHQIGVAAGLRLAVSNGFSLAA